MSYVVFVGCDPFDKLVWMLTELVEINSTSIITSDLNISDVICSFVILFNASQVLQRRVEIKVKPEHF